MHLHIFSLHICSDEVAIYYFQAVFMSRIKAEIAQTHEITTNAIVNYKTKRREVIWFRLLIRFSETNCSK